MQCPECGGKAVTSFKERQSFWVAIGRNIRVRLTDTRPVRRCLNDDCKFEWFDHVAEKIRDKTVADFRLTQKYKVIVQAAEVFDRETIA